MMIICECRIFSRLSLQRSGKDHSILMSLPSGIYRYRFIVDGERRFIPDFPCITDETGNTVNFLDVDVSAYSLKI